MKCPNVSKTDVEVAGKILVFACINSGAETLSYKQEGFRSPEGEFLGDYEITVRRLDTPIIQLENDPDADSQCGYCGKTGMEQEITEHLKTCEKLKAKK